MSITQDQLHNIANLSKLRLKNEEKVLGNLNNILDYVSELEKVDTDGVNPTVSVVHHNQPLREDNINNGSGEELLKCSNQKVVASQIALSNIMR